ncbi:MAG: prephenate dehydrogenase/arogenate dehydrogenase family protein [Bryobacteraceae bacterium]|nr:prephenate dehydrogenase/arogenate dehydrogenase family protein [Bryobacteraceae bacterium]
MKRLAIAGVGLIGGSFALALRAAGVEARITGIDLGRNLSTELANGVIDDALPLEEACATADLIYLALPIGNILELLPRVAAACGENCLVTDAGSTKSEIVRRAAEVFVRGQFLGGHPMAGKETRGVTVAEAGLFRGRPYLLTPRHPPEMETSAARMLLEWIQAMGGRPAVMAPEEHDETVALTSHLPQMLSTALASLLEGKESRDRLVEAAGPGLIDSTRLALSPWGVWADIISTNRPAIEKALLAYEEQARKLRLALASEDGVKEYFESGRRFAEKLRKNAD